MNDVIVIISTGWGGAVIVGLILLNSVVLAGLWSKHTHDKQSPETIAFKLRFLPIETSVERRSFFDDWIHRVYFVFTMGCAFMLVSLPYYPLSPRTRYLLWMILTATTLFGAFRLYLAWQGRDSGLRELGKWQSSTDNDEQNSPVEDPLHSFSEWLQELEYIARDSRNPMLDISIQDVRISSDDLFLLNQDQSIAEGVIHQLALKATQSLREYDLVCMMRDARVMVALVGCSQEQAGKVAQRIVDDMNQDVLMVINRNYSTRLRAEISASRMFISSEMLPYLVELGKMNRDLISSEESALPGSEL